MNLFQLAGVWNAAVLPAVPFPKAPTSTLAYPGYRTNTTVNTSAIRRVDRQMATSDRLITARNLSDTRQVIRSLAHSSPDLSSALSFILRVGIPEKYSMVSRDMDGKINREATALAHELIRRMTYLGNLDGSFTAQLSLQSLSEQLAIELMLDGAMCAELTLDKARVPASIFPVSVPTLKFYEEEEGFRMVQDIGGNEINLDVATVFYVALDQFQTEAYPSSYLEAAIQPILMDLDFNNDTRRVLKRAVLPRLKAIIDSEAVKRFTPPEILADGLKFQTYKQQIIQGIEQSVNSLNPEDALVSYDLVDFDTLDQNGSDPSTIIQNIQKVVNSKLAAGAKTLPTILGHGSNSNASSTEAMLYLKQANIVRVKLGELYSRLMTTAVRLLGQDCYVEFNYEPLDLRPENELEAFKAMKQSRTLELLSLGLLTDEDACIALTGNLPPDGYQPLSGTMFQFGKRESTENPASNTSAAEQTLTGNSPRGAKSGNSNQRSAK